MGLCQCHVRVIDRARVCVRVLVSVVIRVLPDSVRDCVRFRVCGHFHDRVRDVTVLRASVLGWSVSVSAFKFIVVTMSVVVYGCIWNWNVGNEGWWPEKSGKDRAYDGEMDCVGCPWKTESAVRIYATFLVLIVLLMWRGVEDWDGLDIWSVRVWMIVFQPLLLSVVTGISAANRRKVNKTQILEKRIEHYLFSAEIPEMQCSSNSSKCSFYNYCQFYCQYD